MRGRERFRVRRQPGWLAPVLAAVTSLLLAALAVATNLATGLLPETWGWAKSAWLWWGLAGVLAPVVAVLTAWQVRGVAMVPSQAEAPNHLVEQQVAGAGLRGQVQQVRTMAGGTVIGRADRLTIISTPPRTPTTPGTTPSAAPQRVDNLPPRNPHFVGRVALLATLDQHLRGGELTAIVAIRGMAGVGKSLLALEYAYRHLHQLKLVWWIPAEKPSTIAAALAELAPHLGVPREKDDEAKVAGVLAYLRSQSDWLLVFDNAEDPDHLRGYLVPHEEVGVGTAVELWEC